MNSIITTDLFNNYVLPNLGGVDKLNCIGTCSKLFQSKPLVMNTIISRLAMLLKDTFNTDEQDNFETIKYISGKGIIAGGSMVYALNEHVSIDEVSDIDVYINKKRDFAEIIDYLYQKRGRNINRKLSTPIDLDENFLTRYVFPHYGGDVSYGELNIVNVLYANKHIQLIYFNYSSPFDILTTFDLDYVQVAFWRDNVYLTKEARFAHETKRISYFRKNINRLLLQKAINKGFAAPLVYDEVEPETETMPLSINFNLAELQFLQLNKIPDIININELEINEIHIAHKSIGTYSDINYQLNDQIYNPHHMEVSYDILDYDSFRVVIAINVLSLNTLADGYVFITPLHLKQRKYDKIVNMFIIDYCKVYPKASKAMRVGSNVVEVEFRFTEYENQEHLRLKVYKVAEQNVIPIPIAKDVRIVTN